MRRDRKGAPPAARLLTADIEQGLVRPHIFVTEGDQETGTRRQRQISPNPENPNLGKPFHKVALVHRHEESGALDSSPVHVDQHAVSASGASLRPCTGQFQSGTTNDRDTPKTMSRSAAAVRRRGCPMSSAIAADRAMSRLAILPMSVRNVSCSRSLRGEPPSDRTHAGVRLGSGQASSTPRQSLDHGHPATRSMASFSD